MDRIYRLQTAVLGMPRLLKQALMVMLDAVVFPFIVVLAYSIRLDTWLYWPADTWLLVAAPVITIGMLFSTSFYLVVVRYLGSETVWSVIISMSVSTVLLAALAYMVPAQFVPRSVFVIYWLLGIMYLGGSRFLVRRYLHWMTGYFGTRRAVAIYGAGSAGIQSAAALQNGEEFWPVAFVDDDPRLQGSRIQGLKVLDRSALQKLARRGEIDTVLLSMPSLTRQKRMEIVHFLETLHVKVKSIPALPDIINGRSRIEEVRDVAIEDLLGRDPVPPDAALLHASVTGKAVLVTGAGGSIGSELCRQAVALDPVTLVLMDVSEYALYALERELAPLCEQRGIRLVLALGSVLNPCLVRETLTRHRVQTVYHAAAYKHVPIVEDNVLAGAENNILGTLSVAEQAEQAGVERFILISTDKAVRPTNVMGATKRMAELVLQGLAQRGGRTVFTMVRFGNVLGSSGSVVPLFRQQIQAGGPVTVTHPEVTRYFMTIPEAAQLVLQAGSMATGGEVFVLDMGQPVRIYDLAVTMVHLMGLTVRNVDAPEGDIEIRFSGLRPGEKLYEELLIGDDSIGTAHPGILQAREDCFAWEEVAATMQRLAGWVSSGDEASVRAMLQHYVAGFEDAGH